MAGDLRFLFFDLDGTLTHPHEGITRCMQHALRECGAEPPDAADLRRFIGPPLRDSFQLLLRTEDQSRVDAAVAAYRARFETTGMFENAVCPGMEDVLARLSSGGRKLSVVTAKPTVFARRILDHFALDGFFGGVYGPDLSSTAYSKESLIRGALASSGASPQSTCMIGDRAEDVLGARANGVHAIAVAWGYGSSSELEAACPDKTVDSARELLQYLEHTG